MNGDFAFFEWCGQLTHRTLPDPMTFLTQPLITRATWLHNADGHVGTAAIGPEVFDRGVNPRCWGLGR